MGKDLIPGFNSKNKNLLNIYLFGESEDFIKEINNKKSYFCQNGLYNWITEFSHKEITRENINLINNDIVSKLQIREEYNCILIFISEQKFEDKISIIKKYLEETKKIYWPSIILAIDEQNQNIIGNNEIKDIIEIVYYSKDKYFNIENKIKLIYNYYFNIDDLLTNFYSILDEFVEENENINMKEFKSKYNATFNILILGRPGCGKSTLINLLLNEKKAREGIGFSITKLFSQYIHKDYPITLTDTPGFENDKDLKRMENFLYDYNKFFKIGRNKFHLILYLINASNPRTFIGSEMRLINIIYTNLKIPIFFVCTRARTEQFSRNFSEEVKINLIQKFGLNTKLDKNIYCSNLLNEKDGIYKRFGIDNLLIGIKEYFSKEIVKINIIKSRFGDNKSKINTVTNDEFNLNILSSLEKSTSFNSYLTFLLRSIIEKYKYLVQKIDKNIPDLEEKLKKIIGTLKNHLAFELNIESSKINESSFEKCDITCNDIMFNREENNIKKKYLTKIDNIENFMITRLSELIEDIDTFMEKIILNYETAINSFIFINDDINKNYIN